MVNKKETRMLDVEMRVADDDQKMIIEGYPITFNAPATHYGMTEIISKNALDKTDMTDVPLKYNHEDAHPIMARTRNGSLQLSVDDIGLKMRAELIDTQANKDIYKSIQAGLLDKMSFAFVVSDDEYDYDTDTRTITGIEKLYDVSVVDMPFYDSTSVYARGLNNAQEYVEQKRKDKVDKLKRKMEIDELLQKIK